MGELRHGKDDVEVREREQFAGARRDLAVARLRLALGTVAVAAGNGVSTITCLMGSVLFWGVAVANGV